MKGILTQGKMELKGNGGIQRDFMFVEDAVNGILCLGEKLVQKEIASGKSFVLATGKMTSIHALAELIQRVSPEKCVITFNETALQHERELAPLDLGPTQRELGWKNQYSLEQGVRATMEWYRAYFAKPGGHPL
jgi:nucleoside-diphosphate-sugar epimerase